MTGRLVFNGIIEEMESNNSERDIFFADKLKIDTPVAFITGMQVWTKACFWFAYNIV